MSPFYNVLATHGAGVGSLRPLARSRVPYKSGLIRLDIVAHISNLTCAPYGAVNILLKAEIWSLDA
jgi:hypothetical protein